MANKELLDAAIKMIESNKPKETAEGIVLAAQLVSTSISEALGETSPILAPIYMMVLQEYSDLIKSRYNCPDSVAAALRSAMKSGIRYDDNPGDSLIKAAQLINATDEGSVSQTEG